MGVGLEVYNTAGTLQVSTDVFNLACVAKGVHNMSTNGSAGPVGTRRSFLQIPNTNTPLLAVNPVQNGGDVLISFSVHNSDFHNWGFITTGATSAINWWLFDIAVPPATNVGLEVYNTAGQLTYSTAMKLLRRVPLNAQATGRQYAAIQGSISGVKSWDGGAPGQGGIPDEDRYWKASHFDAIVGLGAKVGVERRLIDIDTSVVRTFPLADTNYGPENHMIVDVTNF